MRNNVEKTGAALPHTGKSGAGAGIFQQPNFLRFTPKDNTPTPQHGKSQNICRRQIQHSSRKVQVRIHNGTFTQEGGSVTHAPTRAPQKSSQVVGSRCEAGAVRFPRSISLQFVRYWESTVSSHSRDSGEKPRKMSRGRYANNCWMLDHLRGRQQLYYCY